MDARRDEVVAEGVHLEHRGQLRRIAEIEGIHAFGHAGAGHRFDGQEARRLAVSQALADEREVQAGHVAAAAGAPDHNVGVVVGQGHLQQRFLADHRLMQQDVVEHTAQAVLGVGVPGGDLHRLADGNAQAAGAVGVLRQDVAPGVGQGGGAGVNLRAEAFHQDAAVGLLVVADLDHEDLDLDPEHGPGHRQRRSPLACAGFGGDLADAFLAVVVGLGDGRVGLVAAHRADALVFVVDAGRGIQRLLQPPGAEQWRWPPQAVDVPHRLRDFDVALGADFLLDQGHWKERGQVVGADRLARAGMQDGGGRHGQVGDDVVPCPRELVFGQDVLDVLVVRHEVFPPV